MTAVVAARLLRGAAEPHGVGAVGVVCAGLALLGSCGRGGGRRGRAGLAEVGDARYGGRGAAARAGGRAAAGAGAGRGLGLGAGLGFGVVEVAVRLIDGLSAWELFRNPAAYALVLGGGAAFLR